MVYGLITIGVSAAVLLILTALFRFEQKRGERVALSTVRNFFDTLVMRVVSKCRSIFGTAHAGMVRTTIHYVVHHVLGSVITVLTRLQKKLFRVYEKNKWQQRVEVSEGQGDAHLSAIAEHKKETALTSAQKKKLRKH